MTAIEAMNLTKELSIKQQKLKYLYWINGDFKIFSVFRENWLFLAYPNGVSTISKKGKEILAGELS